MLDDLFPVAVEVRVTHQGAANFRHETLHRVTLNVATGASHREFAARAEMGRAEITRATGCYMTGVTAIRMRKPCDEGGVGLA